MTPIARTLPLFVAAMIWLAAVPPAAAQQVPSPEPVVSAGLPDFLSEWFPQFFKKDQGPQPEETLIAPFAPGDAKAAPDAQAGVLYRSSDGHEYRIITGEGRTYDIPEYAPLGPGEESSRLDVSHRRSDQVADWLMRATSEIFTMDSAGYQKHLERLATGMSDSGMADFTKFMQDSNMLKELESQGMKLQGYVEEPPLLLNEGPLNGRYRWLFEMPVTVTFLARGAKTYDKIENVDEHSLHFLVQTQVGRVEKGPSDDNVVIETWRVRADSEKPTNPAQQAPR